MAEPPTDITISMEQIRDFEFRVKFDIESAPDLLADEAPPTGRGAGPSPSRMLAAAVGNCLCASWLFCARKARLELGPVRAQVTLKRVRNEQGRMRIGRILVRIEPGITTAQGAERCLSLFQEYCTVSASVRQGIPIEVEMAGFGPFAPAPSDAAL